MHRRGRARVTPERLDRLELENANLKKRLEAAKGRTRQLLERVRFLRQQHEEGTSMSTRKNVVHLTIQGAEYTLRTESFP